MSREMCRQTDGGWVSGYQVTGSGGRRPHAVCEWEVQRARLPLPAQSDAREALVRPSLRNSSQGRSEQVPGPICAEDVFGVVSVISTALIYH